MTARPMVCLPLGFGLAGEPNPIRWDGRTYDCIPFHVEVPGIRVIEQSPSHHSLVQYLGDWDVMIDRNGPLAAHLRDPITPAEAERLLAILEADDLGGWTPPGGSHHLWITHEVMRCLDDRAPEPICRLLRRAQGEGALSFACLTMLRCLANVTLAEIAHVQAVPPATLRARLAARSGLWKRI